MNKIDLSGRVAIITGGAQGLGLAIAERTLASEATVICWDRDADRLSRLPYATATVDVTDEVAVGAAVKAALDEHGRIDILVNSAGVTGPNATTWDYPPDAWRNVLEVNLTGTFLACRAVLPAMRSRGYGRIINIASVAGKDGNPNASAYSASKAGVIALTKSLGKELAEAGILVNAVTPAAIHTKMFEQMSESHIAYMLSKIPMGRFGTPAELAALVAWLASEECGFSTGAVFDLSGGRATY
jgi:3-oxoacyl-[acyl-carrier protein] reductase